MKSSASDNVASIKLEKKLIKNKLHLSHCQATRKKLGEKNVDDKGLKADGQKQTFFFVIEQ